MLALAAASHLLVVAPQAWMAALGDFATAKRRLPWIGSCELVSVESLQLGQSGDEAERLKRGIFARWKSAAEADRVDCVLLVGDAHTLPVRYMMLDRATKAAADVAFYASDLYYADLADESGHFDDWNARTDGVHARYVGEVHGESGKSGPIDADGCGLLPEIAVGRWPAASVEEAVAIAAKTLAHDAVCRSARRARPTVEVVACGEWIDNRTRITAVSDGLRGNFDVRCMSYFAENEQSRPDPARVAESFAAGPSLMLHTGHGDAMLWHHGLRADDLGRNAGQRGLPVLMSIGCSTSVVAPQPPYEPYRDADGTDHAGTNAGEVFTAPPAPPACIQPRALAHDSIGAQSVRRATGGAVAYIGCATGSQPCAHTLLDGFAGFLAQQPDASVGEAWRSALAHYVTAEKLGELKPTEDWYPPSIYFQPMKFVLLGDPTARLH